VHRKWAYFQLHNLLLHTDQSESLHFVRLAISTCLFTSSPRPDCPAELRSSSTPELSAALTASALVRFLLQVWQCSAPLQPSLRLPFPTTPLLVIFCAHLTMHRSLSCSISHFPRKFPSTFLTALCPIWHICCLDTGCECLPLPRFPFLGYRWNCLVLYFPEPNNTPIRFFVTFNTP
jgi:hypothetical protein